MMATRPHKFEKKVSNMCTNVATILLPHFKALKAT